MKTSRFPKWLTQVDERWTLFLDRDGTINTRLVNDYVKDYSEFTFINGVLDAMPLLTTYFGKTIIVTNQQGVGKELMTVEDLQSVHDQMLVELHEVGAQIDEIYSCTELALQWDNCRKPNLNMALQAVAQFPMINLRKSVMIGDMPSDIQFGINGNMRTVFIGNTSDLGEIEPDMVFNSLQAFTEVLQEAIYEE